MPSFLSPEGVASARPSGNKAAWISEELNRRTLLGARSAREIALCWRMLSSSRPNSFLSNDSLQEPVALAIHGVTCLDRSRRKPHPQVAMGLRPMIAGSQHAFEILHEQKQVVGIAETRLEVKMLVKRFCVRVLGMNEQCSSADCVRCLSRAPDCVLK